MTMVSVRAEEVHRARSTLRRNLTLMVAAETERIGHLAARLATLVRPPRSPAAMP